jgi:hypothetical protein
MTCPREQDASTLQSFAISVRDEGQILCSEMKPNPDKPELKIDD